MNPISINATIKYRDPHRGLPRAKFKLKYNIALKLNDQDIWNKYYSISPKIRKGTNGGATTYKEVVLDTFSVKESGKYSLNMKKMLPSKTYVSYIDIDVRRNVIFANMKIMILGIIFIFLSLICYYLSQRKS